MSDNLESYFRKHLKDEAPGSDEWNIPSAGVWDKVQPEINKRKGIFIPWKYFYIFGIGLILMISTFVLLPDNNKVSQLSTDNNELQSEKLDPSKSNDIEKVTSDKIIPENNYNNSEKVSSNPSDESKAITNNGFFDSENSENVTKPGAIVILKEQGANKNKSTDAKSPNEGIQTGTPSSRTVVPVLAVNEITTDKSETQYATFSKADDMQTSFIESDNLSDVYVYSNVIEQFPDDQGNPAIKGFDYLNTQKANPIPFSPGKFGIGAYYAPTYTSTKVSGLELPGNDQMGNHYLFSNNWGFDLYYYLSFRFTIVSGVGSSEIRSWSKTTSQFNYDSSTEHDMGNNVSANSTAQTSPTPFGALSSEVIYSFPSDANIPDGELMESVSETFQNVRYLSIPIGLEYNLLNQEKNLLFLETGINYNLSMRDQTELIPQIIHEGDEMKIMDSKITQDPNYENNYWGFYVGTGYKFKLNKRIQLMGTIRYNRSISPLESIGSATTNVQGYQLKVGVVYLLH